MQADTATVPEFCSPAAARTSARSTEQDCSVRIGGSARVVHRPRNLTEQRRHELTAKVGCNVACNAKQRIALVVCRARNCRANAGQHRHVEHRVEHTADRCHCLIERGFLVVVLLVQCFIQLAAHRKRHNSRRRPVNRVRLATDVDCILLLTHARIKVCFLVVVARACREQTLRCKERAERRNARTGETLSDMVDHLRCVHIALLDLYRVISDCFQQTDR